MTGFTVMPALVEDEQALCDIFLDHISAHNEYISHGEIQMGVGEGKFVDGGFVTRVAPQARRFWLKYIHGNLTDPDGAVVYKAVTDDGRIIGFSVGEIMDDGADPFGMVCDVLVMESSRTKGVGTLLLDSVLEWFRSKDVNDVYLESGLNNHAAHEYFIRRGFKKVSEIYKLVR